MGHAIYNIIWLHVYHAYACHIYYIIIIIIIIWCLKDRLYNHPFPIIIIIIIVIL